ncbi:hypothetical protein [Yaravirus sp. 'brasiliensis']|uniref:Uncharacterized protein n=1 Tax=Yaravirus sp. 'brasiliensis' TaxID=2739681 RepID=A0AAE7E1N9_9VIRU|nr:hypothetical protein QKS73_gp72 [Yaravirus brasiliensis]QKE44405.1 hypothetical protein [Yaravirus brasiliensis]
MNGALRNKRPALPPTPQQIHDANYDIRYVAEPDHKRARFLNRNPVFAFRDPAEPEVRMAPVGTGAPTNEPIDLSTMI